MSEKPLSQRYLEALLVLTNAQADVDLLRRNLIARLACIVSRLHPRSKGCRLVLKDVNDRGLYVQRYWPAHCSSCDEEWIGEPLFVPWEWMDCDLTHLEDLLSARLEERQRQRQERKARRERILAARERRAEMEQLQFLAMKHGFPLGGLSIPPGEEE